MSKASGACSFEKDRDREIHRWLAFGKEFPEHVGAVWPLSKEGGSSSSTGSALFAVSSSSAGEYVVCEYACDEDSNLGRVAPEASSLRGSLCLGAILQRQRVRGLLKQRSSPTLPLIGE